MLVFDDEDTMKKFTDPFEKSCKYCDSVTQRVVEPTSLDYKVIFLKYKNIYIRISQQ